ncbi:unnamed protein product [Onchocerca ochengi]|uniref:Ovule protein n=1 Tax=Onchocerca ochengi TaxID=42157 RepID=A0A182EUJ5_ONCOC|nr:unnamed protein product [Onchocerca ochengi]
MSSYQKLQIIRIKWQRFPGNRLSDQLKLLYVEERNRILNPHSSHYSTNNKQRAHAQLYLVSQLLSVKIKLLRYKTQKYHDSTVLNTIMEGSRGSRSVQSDSPQTELYTSEKRCNCLYNKRELL